MFNEWKELMESLKGELVIVTYSYNPLKQCVGWLIDYDDEGQVNVRAWKDGKMRYIWPNLNIRKYTDEA